MFVSSSNVCKLTLILSCCFYVFAQRYGDLRVAGSFSNANPPSGRLEIFLNNAWGTICMDEFTMESANTACRQLGREMAISFGNARNLGFGEGSGPIHLTGVRCGLNNDLIIQCRFGSSTVRCSHFQDVAIQCSFDFLEYEGAVRLVSGTSTSNGRLEVFLGNLWGTVCDPTFAFPISIASVACKQLGYTRAIQVDYSNSNINIPVWVTSVSCSEMNVCFRPCYSITDIPQNMISTCRHIADVVVTCEYVEALRTAGVGSAMRCSSLNTGDEDDEKSNSTGTIIGLTFGLGTPAVIFIIYMLYKSGKLKKWKRSWDDFVDRVRHFFHPRPDTHNVELQSHSTPAMSSIFDEPTGDEPTSDVNTDRYTAPTNEYDKNKPPDYNDALGFRKPKIDDGYPEPSLVDEPPPPSYNSVY